MEECDDSGDDDEEEVDEDLTGIMNSERTSKPKAFLRSH